MAKKVNIKIKGHLDSKWKDWFDGVVIYQDADNTVIEGNLEDESKIHGTMNMIRDLNLKLLSINTIDEK